MLCLFFEYEMGKVQKSSNSRGFVWYVSSLVYLLQNNKKCSILGNALLSHIYIFMR
jgi:hypothetical protein